MLKPAGASCNLACEYCYYLEKERLCHEDFSRREVRGTGPKDCSAADADLLPPSSFLLPRKLTDSLLETFIQQYLEAQTMPQVLFTWHGGEPLLRPLAFYRRALELQRRYARGRHIDNCLQTNGTLLTDEWCRFLHDNHFLVGISIDGPQHLHDAYRRDRHGEPTWERVMKGIRLLQKHGVEWNAMATVNRVNADHPVAFYRFFKEIGCQYLQFTPVVERHSNDRERSLLAGTETGGELADFSVTPMQWGRFLCQLYDEWVRHDVGQVFVQLFDATLANWVSEPPGLCSLGTTCAHNAVMEADGSVYCCDHFVFPDYRLGNIREQTLTELVYGQRQQLFGRQKVAALPRQCRECRYGFACHGECPRNRFVSDRYGEPGLNYLCAGYTMFFDHVAADMDFMRSELLAGRAPANVMDVER